MSSFSKKFITLISLVVGFSAAHAYAHGVEKIVPFDAHNFIVEEVSVGGLPNGQELISSSASEGDQYRTTWAPSVMVTVSYDSADKSEVPKSGSGNDGQFTSWDLMKPQFVVFLEVSKEKYEEYVANKAYRPTAKDIVATLTNKEAVKKVAKYQDYKCQYDSEYGYKIDPNCREPAPQYMNVAARTVKVDFK